MDKCFISHSSKEQDKRIKKKRQTKFCWNRKGTRRSCCNLKDIGNLLFKAICCPFWIDMSYKSFYTFLWLKVERLEMCVYNAFYIKRQHILVFTFLICIKIFVSGLFVGKGLNKGTNVALNKFLQAWSGLSTGG